MELKTKDKKILMELFQNSKQSHRQLAKKVNLSKETVSKKISLYEKEKYIKSFSLRINYEKLGFEEYNLFIRLKNISEMKLKNFIQYLENHPNIAWIGKSFGKYDFKIALIVPKNSKDINNILFELSQNSGVHIDTIDYLIVRDKYKSSSKLFIKNILGIQPDSIITNNFNIKIKNYDYKIDKTDKIILYNLGINPKICYTELSNICSLTAEGVKYRVKQLENQGIITGHSIVFNGNKFNKIWCLVLLNINIGKIAEFKEYIQRQKLLSSYVETLGIWNFNITFFADNIEELYNGLNSIREKYSEEIKNLEFLIFFEIYKYPKTPKCVLE